MAARREYTPASIELVISSIKMIDFNLTPEQQQFREAVSSFAKTRLKGAAAIYSQHDTQEARFRSIKSIYAEGVKAGLIKAQVPKALGGTADSAVDAAILIEEIFAVDAASMISVLAAGLGLMPLIMAGSEEQQRRLLSPFLVDTGTPIASFVHSEPGGTANWLEKGGQGLGTTARKDGDDWIITGEKLWTSNSGGWEKKGADLQCVVCRYSEDGGPQDPDRDPAEDILLLMVTPEVIAANEPGAYQVLSEPELIGMPAASGPHSRFTNLRVPSANLLCPPGTGAQVVEQVFGLSAALVGAMGVGIMRATFEAALKYAKNNSRGGTVTILERQSVADLLIDIKMRIETSRLFTWKALHAIENGPGDWNARLELALEAKIHSSEAAVQSVVDAMKAVGM